VIDLFVEDLGDSSGFRAVVTISVPFVNGIAFPVGAAPPPRLKDSRERNRIFDKRLPETETDFSISVFQKPKPIAARRRSYDP
jgi:hypothetical protein